MKKFMERFIEAVRKYEELLSYAQGGFILPYPSNRADDATAVRKAPEYR